MLSQVDNVTDACAVIIDEGLPDLTDVNATDVEEFCLLANVDECRLAVEDFGKFFIYLAPDMHAPKT